MRGLGPCSLGAPHLQCPRWPGIGAGDRRGPAALWGGAGGWRKAGAGPPHHGACVGSLPAPAPSLLSCNTAVISAVNSLHSPRDYGTETAVRGHTPGARVSQAEMSEACSASPRDEPAHWGAAARPGGTPT